MLRARVVTALVMLVVLGGVIFLLPPPAVAAAFGLIAALAAWEWAGLMRIDAPGRVMYAGVIALFCWQTYILGESGFLLFWSAAAAFWLLAAVVWLRYRWTMVGNDFLGYALGLILIVAAWAALVSLHARGPWLLLAVMGTAWVADIAAYAAGRACGRHKLAPSISPGKTWEGVAGATIAVLAYGFALAASVGALAESSALRLLLAVLLLVLLTAISVIGDLFESLVKRQAGVKDSSNLLPGHGGILDRIDSLLALLPVAALALYWSGR
jgi:phosphatidate cytidylyltransferase